jgi:hypothetical protein
VGTTTTSATEELVKAAYDPKTVWLDDLERDYGLDSPQFRAALEARGLVVLDTPAKATYCWCLVPKGHPFGGHTGICCSVHRDCDLPACYCDCTPDYDPEDDGIHFADPGGRSALRAATHERCPSHGCHMQLRANWSWCPGCGTKLNPRKHPCPSCGASGVLTDEDVALHYVCDACADRAEGIYRGGDY